MEIPVIIDCVVGAIVAIATIVIAWATVVNMRVNKTMKKVMKITTELNLIIRNLDKCEIALYQNKTTLANIGTNIDSIGSKIHKLNLNDKKIAKKQIETIEKAQAKVREDLKQIVKEQKLIKSAIRSTSELYEQKLVQLRNIK